MSAVCTKPPWHQQLLAPWAGLCPWESQGRQPLTVPAPPNSLGGAQQLSTAHPGGAVPGGGGSLPRGGQCRGGAIPEVGGSA